MYIQAQIDYASWQKLSFGYVRQNTWNHPKYLEGYINRFTYIY
jgi:hypothetical protein